MNREKKLLIVMIIYTISSFISRISLFLLLILYTRYLTASEYGYLDLILSASNIIGPIICLQMSDSIFRFLLISNTEEERNGFISSSIGVLIGGIILFSILYLIISPKFITSHSVEIFILLISWALFMFIQQVARGLGKSKDYAISSVIYSIILVSLSFVFLHSFNLKFDGIIIANSVAIIISTIYLGLKINITRYINLKSVYYQTIKKMIKYGLPLLVSAIFWWVVTAANRYFITYYLGVDANGIFAVASKFTSILGFINSIFFLAWQESAIKEFKAEDKGLYYSKMFTYFIKIQFTILLILIPTSRICIQMFIGGSYSNAWTQLPILYIGAVFSGFTSFYGSIFLGSGKTNELLVFTGSGALFTILLNYILIPFIGIYGASITNMVSFIFMWSVIALSINKHVKIKFSKRLFGVFTILSGIFSALSYLRNIFVDLSMVSIGIILLFTLNKGVIEVSYISIKEHIISLTGKPKKKFV